MADTAVHLEQRVLPRVPIRHWIVSLPWGLRAWLGHDRRLCAEVMSAFVGELSRSLRLRARHGLGLGRVADAHTGAVAAIQRTDSAVRLNVHGHVLALDGVYVRDQGGSLVFHALPPPTRADVADIARRTAERIDRLLRARGRSLDAGLADSAPPTLELDEPGLSACYAAAAQGVGVAGQRAGQPPLRLLVPTDARPSDASDSPDDPVAEVGGVNVHARQLVDGRDRKRLERLVRYITRPPVPNERLTRRPDGRIELTLKTVWRDGTRALILEPHDLLARLVAAIPPPRFHLLRYFGVLSSHSRLRSEVVPKPPADASCCRPPPAEGDQLALPGDREPTTAHAPRARWAWVLAHVFAADLDTCPRCGGPMRWRELAFAQRDIARLLAAHGLGPAPPPPRPRAPPPGQLPLPFAR